MAKLSELRAAIEAKKNAAKVPVLPAPASKKVKKEPIPTDELEAILAGPNPHAAMELASRKWKIAQSDFARLKKKPRKKKERVFNDQKQGRLPKGAQFSCGWDGTKWDILLTFPTPGPIPSFSTRSDALFKGQAEVDKKYREWLRNNPPGGVADGAEG